MSAGRPAAGGRPAARAIGAAAVLLVAALITTIVFINARKDDIPAEPVPAAA